MFNPAYSNVVRTFVGTVGAVAVSSVFLFAAAGPAEASTIADRSVSQVEVIGMVTSERAIAY